MKTVSQTLCLTVLLSIGAVQSGVAAPRATDLRCEYQRDPLAVGIAQPRLSWVLESAARGERQTAYRILVASSAAQLKRNDADLWDSGRVASAEQNQITYAGKSLAANAECFWKVQVWNQDAKASRWSAPARWGVGLLESTDWQARWIGTEAQAVAPVEGDAWVWFPEGDPVKSAPAGKRYFRQRFQIPAGATIREAVFFVAADNRVTMHVNGQRAGEHRAWETLHQLDVAPLLRTGDNVLALAAENTAPGPAGLIGKLVVRLATGKELVVPVDASWKCASDAPANWDAPEFDDRTWVPARELGPFGIGPWGRRLAGMPPLPMFRHAFTVGKPLRRAIVHVCGLGHHELFLNGRKVGDQFLDPAWTVFEKTLFYTTHDITAQLKPGANALGVMLGKGFYNTAGDRRVHGVNANRPLKLILQAHLFYADGTEQVITSDGNWRTLPGPITHSAILGGEDYDARALPPGWATAEFEAATWQPATETDGPGGQLVAAYAPPLKEHEVFKPVLVDEPEPGIFVYDFGQNASAIPRLRVRGAAGQKVKLTPAEQRHGMSPRRNDGRGLVNPAGVGRPNYWQYTLRGGPSESWQPQFNYSGFQYVQVEGAVPKGRPNPQGLPVVEELVSVHVRNAARTVGRFECSEPLFNAIDRNIDWAVRANLSHVLTDCPHREKLGWLEVAYLMGPSIAGRYDVAGFYSKIAQDCTDSQRADGLVPTVAPAYPSFNGGFAYTPEWGAAAVIVPWQVHRWYGDRAVLAAHYDTLRGFVDYMRDTSTNLVPRAGLGDWYDYGGETKGPSQFTPVELSAMATFYRCARVVADTAELLGKAGDQQCYTELAGQIREAFNARYFDGAGEYQNFGSPQTANSMALALGLVPPGREQAVLDCIIADVRKRGNQQTAGDIGFVYLLETLARHGRHDVIYDMTLRTNMGSYGFIVNNGWTAMPEAWDANTGVSMNHCMLGHIQQWFLGSLAGIRPEPVSPGFKRFVIAPEPVGDVTWARGEYESIRGRITLSWRIADGRFRLNVTVPPNTSAVVHVPAPGVAGVRESGRAATHAAGVRFLRFENGRAVFEVGGGRYEFAAPAASRQGNAE